MISSNQFTRHSFPKSSNSFADSSVPTSSNAFAASSLPTSDNVWNGENITGSIFGSEDLFSGPFFGGGQYGGFQHFKGRTAYTVR